MNIAPLSTRAAIVRSLCEGNSVRATARLTGTAKGTVLRLLASVGEFCEVYQDVVLRDLSVTRVEADEVWGFCGAKEKNATKEGQGDLWTYIGLCADSKLVFSWLVGRRSGENTEAFVRDIASRLRGRAQITTDGLSWYVAAIENAFGWNGCDFAQLIKSYGVPTDEVGRHQKYSPMSCTGAVRTPIMGKPDVSKVSTSYVERFNLSVRMGNRRMTRLTNGFSKSAENHAHAMAVQMMYFNFCRSHQTLTKAKKGIKTTPAMAAGLTNHVWSVEEVLEKMTSRIGAGVS